MESPPSLRSSIVLMEKVSPFPITPPNRYKDPEMVHVVSPNPRPRKQLRPGSEGICRKLTTYKEEEASRLKEDPVLCGIVQTMMDKLQKLEKKVASLQEIEKKVASLQEMEKKWARMETLVQLRSLVEAWERSDEGKRTKKDLVPIVDKKYAELKETGSAWRKCRDGNLFVEAKALLNDLKDGVEGVSFYLQALSSAIQKETHLPGQEFIDLMDAYIQCNQSVHMSWESEEGNVNLKTILHKARDGLFVIKGRKITAWVLKMVRDLSRRKGMGDLGITDVEISVSSE